MGERLRKTARRPVRHIGKLAILAAPWAWQMIAVHAEGRVDRWGAQLFTPVERLGLIAANYAEGWAAIQTDSILLAIDPLLDRLDAALGDALPVVISELDDNEIAGLCVFYIQFLRALGSVKGDREDVSSQSGDG